MKKFRRKYWKGKLRTHSLASLPQSLPDKAADANIWDDEAGCYFHCHAFPQVLTRPDGVGSDASAGAEQIP